MSQHTEVLRAGVSVRGTPKRVLYLTKVSYNEPRHEVLVEFSNNGSKRVERHRFFPFTLFSSSIEKEKLQALLISAGFKGFSLEEEGGLLCLKALSFSDLKKIANSLAIFINKKPLILEPERAFLLQKKWSYFDSFEVIGGILYKFSPALGHAWAEGASLPDLGFFLTKEIPFSEAMKVNESDALFLVDLAAWSNLLVVPMEKVPKGKEEKTEALLENIFFSHGELLSFNSSERVYSSGGFEPFGAGEPLSKLDFSLVWAELFSNNFFNIGPETKNCSCCTPIVLDAKNLLPSSLIRVRFMEDDLFFESSSESFSIQYHNNNPQKEQRLSKKKEFFLSSFPTGPFFRNDSVLIPLMDAKRLISQGKAALISSRGPSAALIGSQDSPRLQENASPHQLNWFCLNKESFFSKEIRKSNALLFDLRKSMDSSQQELFSTKPFSQLFFSSLYKALSFSLAQLPNQLTNPNSKFFSTDLAKSIVSVQESTLARFKEFSEKEGYRVLHANKNSAFVKGFASLKLAKDFSAETCLPQPQIAGFSSKSARGFA